MLRERRSTFPVAKNEKRLRHSADQAQVALFAVSVLGVPLTLACRVVDRRGT